MIDWFAPPVPTRRDDGADGALRRWQALVAVRRVARELDERDPSTIGHSERVADIADALAAELDWLPRRRSLLREAALVHDVGKVCVPEAILAQPGPLSPGDYCVVKEHAALGARIASAALSDVQAAWVRHHHERWDGRGYPDGLVGEEIPRGALILCLADAWDAMTHRSWSGGPLERHEALEECRREAGRQFAPHLVEALERVVHRLPLPAPPPAPLQLLPA
jgi:putative nucleotidyltransferase with HDIG domain